MTIAKPLIQDSQFTRQLQRGDVLAGAEQIATLTTAGAGTLTAALLLSGILSRTGPGAGYIDTTDTAQNIINALLANNYFGSADMSSAGGVEAGTTVRLTYVNTVAFAMTLAAGAGVTLGSNVNISASSVKDYLLTITNGTPTQVYAATTANGSAVITGLLQSQTNDLSVGQSVTGTGIPASTTIISIQPGVGVTLSANATATGSLVALTFGPSVRIDSLGQKLL
jgi:hypothetical protein